MGGGAWAYEEQSGMSWDSLVNLRGRGALGKWGGDCFHSVWRWVGIL